MDWTVGQNARIDYVGGRNADAMRTAAELVAFAPDVIMADGIFVAAALKRRPAQSRSYSFWRLIRSGSDWSPALRGRVAIVTGFTHFEYPTAGKWLEVLKEIAPRVRAS